MYIVIKALEEEENKNRNVRQTDSPHQQIKTFSPAHTVPSKVFQYVDRKFSESDGNIIKNRTSSVSEDQNPKGITFFFRLYTTLKKGFIFNYHDHLWFFIIYNKGSYLMR